MRRIKIRPVTLALLILVLAGLALNVNLAFSQTHAEVKKAELEGAIISSQAKIRQASQLYKDAEKLREELAELKRSPLPFASEEQCNELTSLLFQWARESKAELIGCSTAWAIESQEDIDYPVLIHKLQLRGSPDSLAGFLHLVIISSLPSISIGSLELLAGKAYWTLNLEVKIYSRPSVSPATGAETYSVPQKSSIFAGTENLGVLAKFSRILRVL